MRFLKFFQKSEYNYATSTRAGSNPDEALHVWEWITKTRSKCDFLVVIMHGGKEMHPYPTPYQMKLFRFIIDIGADAVIGHHSHVIGGYEIYHHKPIIYSLGNFLFDEEDNPPDWYRGAVAEIIYHSKNDFRLSFYLTKLENNMLFVVSKQNT